MAKIGLYSRQAYALGPVTRMCPAAYKGSRGSSEQRARS
jgi:hypothetical protein